MDYVGSLFRPPSEADSLLIQATVGCSHNRCTYCAMYQGKTFRPKPWDVVRADLDEGLAQPYYRRVFLMDGDAMILSTERLLQILNYIREKGPHITRVSLYGDARGITHKSHEELVSLREAGLGMVYHGMESGSEEVLRRLQKGASAAQQVEAAQKLKAAGIRYSAIVLLGAGGVELSKEHATATAQALSAADPDYIGALMLMLVPGTPLWEDQQAGRFVLPDSWGLLEELHTLLREMTVTKARFSANHASNVLPMTGELPNDQKRLCEQVAAALARHDPARLKPDWARGL